MNEHTARKKMDAARDEISRLELDLAAARARWTDARDQWLETVRPKKES
jgi:hypothetical protein